MSINYKRKLELSIAVANKTRDLKHKLELSKALAATSDMDDYPIVHFMPQTLGKKKRVSFPVPRSAEVQTKKTTMQHVVPESNVNIRSDATESTRKEKRASFPVLETASVQMEESTVQHINNESNENITMESITDVVDSTSDATNGPVKEKRGRGLTRGLNTQKHIRKCGEKPKIVIPRGNKPVGEHISKHAAQIGVLIRLEAPMKVEGWAKTPDEKKKDIFKRLVQSGVALARETIYEKLANRQDDLLWLCDFWETPKFKKISETQSNNRSNLEYTHKLGTKSRAAHQHENAKMKELKEQQQALPEDERMSVEQICITVLGENSSYAIAKGLNKKSSAKNCFLTSEVSTNGARLEEDLASTQAELANAKADLAIQKSKVDALVKFVENMSDYNTKAMIA